MFFWNSRTSMIFSYPRWRYPISGAASVIVSPSIFTFMFHSPWVIGCCGPMFTQSSAISAAPRLLLAAADVLALRLLGEVLPEGMVLEVLREEDPLELRVPVVHDPHEVPRLPLVVMRRIPQLHEAVDLRVVVGDDRVHLDGRPRLVAVDVVHGLKVVLPVHRGDAREVLEPEFLLKVEGHLDDVLPVDHRLHDGGPRDADLLEDRWEPRAEAFYKVFFRPAHVVHRSRAASGSDVDDGLLLQRVLGRDEQDGDEPEEHGGEDGGEPGEPVPRGCAGAEVARGPVDHEGPKDEEHRGDVEHDEDQGEHVVLEVELDRRLALRQLPALVREVLQRGGVRGAE